MDIYYKVEMSNQWRLGGGGIVDLNCGWYCQDALLSWYCTKHRLSPDLYKNTVKHRRMKNGFNPQHSYCLDAGVPKNIDVLKEYLLKHGPVIAAGKVGLADFGFLGGAEHYVLVVGVRTKSRHVIIYDPLSVDFRNIMRARLLIYKFDHFIKRVSEVLVLNQYSFKMLYRKNDASEC